MTDNTYIFSNHAQAYWDKGLPVIPLNNGKRTNIRNWPSFSKELPDIQMRQSWLQSFPNANIGLVLGDGLVAIDVDRDDLVDILRSVVPESPWERVGQKGCVWLYRADNDFKTRRFNDENGASLVEILAQGAQVVIPPSVHPDINRPYVSNCELLDVLHCLPTLPDNIEDRILSALHSKGFEVKQKKTASFTGKIDTGGRDVGLTSMAGVYSLAVMNGERSLLDALGHVTIWAERFLEASSADEREAHADKARGKLIEFFKRDSDNRTPDSGWDRDVTPDQKRDWDLLLVQEDIALHERYFYNASDHLFYDTYNIEPFEPKAIDAMHGPILVGDKSKSASHYLFLSPKTIKVYGFKFNPEKGLIFEAGPRYTYWNKYVPPEFGTHKGDVSEFTEFLSFLIPEERDREHLLHWIAYALQNPGQRINHAVLWISEEKGIGKSLISDILMKLMGIDNCSSVPAHLIVESRFNDWFDMKCLIVIEEVMTRGRISVANKMKEMITSDRVRIEYKGKDTKEVPNVAKFFLTSNHLDAIRIDENERRYFVIVSDVEARPKSYYNKISEWKTSPFNLAMLNHYFLNRDISQFDPFARAPETTNKLKAVAASRGALEQALHMDFESETYPFNSSVVLLDQIVKRYHRKGFKDSTSSKIREFLKKMKAKPTAIGRQRYTADMANIRSTAWAIKDLSKWVGASKSEIQLEIPKW